ncbi:MAG TPA: maltose alpha-D-glucosyltransferase, partial [Chloroflexota bacterium]|nr:maltose alpha-D-glucosyltransferase [Chloroflexota bacterium]
MGQRDEEIRSGDPLWYKDAVIYELHVRAFRDSDADGIGDFRGLTEKLDYLQDLGVTTIWLLPFYPSPMRDDGYDISDYTAVNPSYGTMKDVRQFVREAHRRGLYVITELVCNHTSDQHPWFQRARHAPPGSSARNFYVWSDSPDRYREARVIFKDFESSNWSWDPVAQAYYWHRFYSHQPDLNFENPAVRRAIYRAMDFWLDMGVDGLRLDAVPYLYERDGTNCENLPETHEVMREMRRHVDEHYSGRMLLAEANQWPEDSVAYFGNGDECHMAFHFPVMPRMFMAIRMEDRFPIIDILAQTPPIPEKCQWALFLRNHDELTLEMVTDEERDYMYRVYARDPEAKINLGIRRRLAPLLGNHRRRIELMNGLLFSFPGTPVVYYGDEIGMGDNIFLGDRNGVRTPMQWSPDRNAGFSQTNPQRLYLPVIVDPEYHFESVNVEALQGNPHSLLWWTKRLITLRKRYKAFSRGSLEFLHPENRKVLVFIRRFQEEQILVVANLSRFVQFVEVDLADYRGMIPVEMFGTIEFPPIGDLPYFLTLAPHCFYWFSLQSERMPEGPFGAPEAKPEAEAPVVMVAGEEVSGALAALLRPGRDSPLLDVLPDYLKTRRWFGGKARRIKSTHLVDSFSLPFQGGTAHPILVQVDYTEGDPDTYLFLIAFASGERADQLRQDSPKAIVAVLRPRAGGEEGVLYDALLERPFSSALLDTIRERRRVRGQEGELVGTPFRSLRKVMEDSAAALEPSVSRVEQSNTSVVFGDRLILKLFRRVETGANPDLEIGRFLAEKGFPHTPAIAGMLEYRRGRKEPATLAILQSYVPNEGDAWAYTLDHLSRYFEHVLTSHPEPRESATCARHLLTLLEKEVPALATQTISGYLESARLLGQRTAEMHLVLGSATQDPAFTPEPFTSFYQRSIYQSMRSLTGRTFQTLRRAAKRLPEAMRDDAQ